ncbi:MAG: hypothetical protein ABGX07_07350 [Pirellulaceae bacterium]
MQTSAVDGNVVLEQSLADLVAEKRITMATVQEWMREPSVFHSRLQQATPTA